MNKNVQLVSSKRGGHELFQALVAASIPLQEKRMEPGSVHASALPLTICLVSGGVSVLVAFATVLRAWVTAREGRQIMITLENGSILNMTGKDATLDSLESLIEQSSMLAAIQTSSDDAEFDEPR